MFLDLSAPRAGVRMRVVRRVGDLGGDERLVEEREVPGREVDEVQVGSRCGVRVRRGGGGIVVVAALNRFGHVGCYLRTDARLARGADYQTYRRSSDGCHGKGIGMEQRVKQWFAEENLEYQKWAQFRAMCDI